MDSVFALFSDITGNESTLRWAFIAIVGLAVASISLGVLFAMSAAADPTRRRLHELVPGKAKNAPGAASEKLSEVLEPLAPLLMPKRDAERATMRNRLQWAGFRAKSSIGLFYALKMVLALLLPFPAAAVAILYFKVEQNTLIAALVGAAFVGNLLPSLYVDRALAKRQLLIRNGFPDALDLLVVCVEAGLGLKSAIARVAEELGASHPVLADEFVILTAELRAGLETETALNNLAERNGLEDIRGFAALLSQSMRFGTSIGETLRVYAGEFREKRMQRAEEAAAKLGVKMLLPMVLCIFPSFFVVAIGPAALAAMKVMGN